MLAGKVKRGVTTATDGGGGNAPTVDEGTAPTADDAAFQRAGGGRKLDDVHVVEPSWGPVVVVVVVVVWLVSAATGMGLGTTNRRGVADNANEGEGRGDLPDDLPGVMVLVVVIAAE